MYSSCGGCVMESPITKSSSWTVLFIASTVINSSCFFGKLLKITKHSCVHLTLHLLCGCAKLCKAQCCPWTFSLFWLFQVLLGSGIELVWTGNLNDCMNTETDGRIPIGMCGQHMAAICFHSRVVSRHTVTAVQLQWDLLPKLLGTVGQSMTGLPGQAKSKEVSEGSSLWGTGCRRFHPSEQSF